MNLLSSNYMDQVLGIDFGTTNSCAYGHQAGRAFIITENSKTTIPSCVLIDNDVVKVGESAKRGRDGTICTNAKRLIGRRWSDNFVQMMSNRCNAEICEKDGFPVFNVGSRLVTPDEVSEHIIRHLIDLAEKQIGKKITKLVVTVPAYFNMDQRNATCIAAQKASALDESSVFIINEPTAAAISYNLPAYQKERHVMVYDLGGGTFDISLIKVEKRKVTVIATGGNNKLGGDDFTAAVANILCQLYSQVNHGQSLLPPDSLSGHKTYLRLYKRLLDIAEDVKVGLKTHSEIHVDLESVTSEGETTVMITESLMEEALQNYIQETLLLMDDVLEQAKLTKDDIDDILLVGGSSKLNLVKKMLSEVYGEEKISDQLDPDHCVSEGALLYYKEFGGQIQDVNFIATQVGGGERVRTKAKTLNEIMNISLGTCVGKDNRYDVMIPKGTHIPGEFSKIYGVHSFQTSVKDALFQGEAEFTKDCEEVAPIEYSGITAASEGHIRLKYTFLVDVGGIVRITVTELPGNRVLYGPTIIHYQKGEDN